MTFALAAWPIIKRFWPFALGIAAMVVILIYRADAKHWHKRYDTEHAALVTETTAHQTDIANVRAATAAAQAADRLHVQEVAAHDTAIQQERSNALEAQLTAARTAAADYAARLRSGTRPAVASGGAATSVSAPASTAGTAASVDPATDVPVSSADLQSCALSDTIARGWQAWWTQVSAAPR